MSTTPDKKPYRVGIAIKGGRLTSGEPLSRGQDIGVYAIAADGSHHILPAQSLVLRIEGRKAIATVELEVDDVDATGLMLEALHLAIHDPEKP